MDTWMYLSQGFAVALTPENLVIALIGCFVGTVVGLLPGLGPINGVAILLPLAFALKLPPESALILLATVYIGCEYGGRISSILLNVPGDAAAIMTALDGYPMAQQGKAGVALSISAVSSFVGSMLAIGGIILFAPALARWSLAFGPAEYFALMVFAIACLGSMMSQNPLKSFMAALIGLGLATVGVDANTGVYRFTFDSVHLSDGVQFIVVVIGLFSVSEILLMLEHTSGGGKLVRTTGRMLFNFKELVHCTGTMLRSSTIGFFVGILPGAGATIASAITYMTEKRLAGPNAKFGEGDIRGVAAPEAANNAASSGAFVPLLTLGIPGSGTTALMLGALIAYGIQPGPRLFMEHPDVFWSVIISMYLGNVVLLILNLPLIPYLARVLAVPRPVLIPMVLLFSLIGVYLVSFNTMDIYVMVLVALVAIGLRLLDFPMAPMLLGFILGGMLEDNLRRALVINDGSLSFLWERPITLGFTLVTLVMLLLPLWQWWQARRTPVATLQSDPT